MQIKKIIDKTSVIRRFIRRYTEYLASNVQRVVYLPQGFCPVTGPTSEGIVANDDSLVARGHGMVRVAGRRTQLADASVATVGTHLNKLFCGVITFQIFVLDLDVS